jgi:phosphoserine/homoserine phosphotransferase
MILGCFRRFLFKSTEQIIKEYPQFPAYETYEGLMEAIKKVV